MEQYMPIVWVGFAIFMLLCRRLYNTACINMVCSRLGLCRNNNYIHKRHNNPVDGVPCCVTCIADCDTTACKTL